MTATRRRDCTAGGWAGGGAVPVAASTVVLCYCSSANGPLYCRRDFAWCFGDPQLAIAVTFVEYA